MTTIVRSLDNLLNKITMYALVLYSMRFLIAAALVLSFFGVLQVPFWGIVASFCVLVGVCFVANRLLSYLYKVPTNNESYVITALILVCLLPPTTDPTRLLYLALAGILAMASKFVVTWRHKHIFNPAAFAAVCISLLGLMSVTWWIGSPFMLPFVALVGLLIVRKLRRFRVFFTFVAASLLMTALVGWSGGHDVVLLLKNAVLSGPLVFFAAIMLTEPATMPNTRQRQLLFALLVGILYAAQLRVGLFSTSPHMVLLLGNIFAFVISSPYRVRLRLKQIIQISPQVYDYVFTPARKLAFMPGQYMEWTLPHPKVDFRGNRRTFTVASSPTEADVHLGVKFYEPSSSFKKALKVMQPGDTILAGQMSGDFTLPADHAQKLVLIAGGIGITPFRSMMQYLVDARQSRDITLFYLVANEQELAYRDVFEAAAPYGVRVMPIIAGELTPEQLQREVPDYLDRTYMISGPNGFVQHYIDMLRAQGIAYRHIVKDYFSGY
jgi:ferredoxin-NADP reductase/Na+-translocating ferredoxin:NAD+ oxidoreductase RnfD subunit